MFKLRTVAALPGRYNLALWVLRVEMGGQRFTSPVPLWRMGCDCSLIATLSAETRGSMCSLSQESSTARGGSGESVGAVGNSQTGSLQVSCFCSDALWQQTG